MAKKMMQKESMSSSWWQCCSWKEVLFFAGAVFFGALGLALLIEGLFAQWNIGFRAGFVSYLLGLLFIGIAKHCKCMAWHSRMCKA